MNLPEKKILRVMSVSVGPSSRNSKSELEVLGRKILIERRGTDGDFMMAEKLIKENDGLVDAIGLGGIDFYLSLGRDRYPLHRALNLRRAARRTPVVDGTCLKNAVEGFLPAFLEKEGISLKGKKVFFVCALNRYCLAEAMERSGAEMLYGDFMFALKLPIPVRSLKKGRLIARLICPVATRLPYRFLYPVTDRCGRRVRFEKYFRWADIIAGDFNYIYRYAPEELCGKTIVTTTVTEQNLEEMRRRGVLNLVTTYGSFNGRSYGANVMEALLIAVLGKYPLTPYEYSRTLERLGLGPAIYRFR